jgi:AcrR family transcriptional regulator
VSIEPGTTGLADNIHRVSADEKTKATKNRNSAESRQLLIDSAIKLLLVNNFQEVTGRKVAMNAGADPKTIRRLFGSYEGLLLAVYHYLRVEGASALSSTLKDFESSKIACANGVDLKTRLAAWLVTSGTPTEKFHFGDKNLDFETAVWARAFGDAVSERAKKAFAALAYVSSTGNTIFGPLVEGLDSQLTEDGYALLAYLAKHLEQIQEELGFDK